MQRRKALQAIVFFSVAGNMLVSCKNKHEAISKLGLKNFHPKDDELDLIDEMAKTIFPVEKTPMFAGQSAFPFVVSMVDGLFTKEERDTYVEGLKAFEEATKKKYNKTFVALSPEQKMEMLKMVNGLNEEKPSALKKFFVATKNQTIQYFTSTEKYLREVRKYEMAPGRFTACIDINKIQSQVR